MLKIIRSSDPVTVEQLVICIYSPPGLGKTSLGFTADFPLDLDFDHGVHRATNRKDSVPVSSWNEVTQITPEDLAAYKTVVVDTAGRALDFLSADIIAGNPKMGRGGALTLQGFGELKAKFSAWLRSLRMLGKDVILIAHMDEQRSGDDIVERLDVQGGSKGEIYKSADAMGRIVLRNGQRFLDFSPRENSFGKNPCNLDLIPYPAPGEMSRTLGELIQTVKAKLNEQTEQQKAAQREIEEWEEWLKSANTLEAFNGELETLPKASTAVKSLVHKKARSLGFVWNKEQGVYERGVRLVAS